MFGELPIYLLANLSFMQEKFKVCLSYHLYIIVILKLFHQSPKNLNRKVEVFVLEKIETEVNKMKPETMEKLAHELIKVKDNLELQTVSLDMFGSISNPKKSIDPFIVRVHAERLTDTLFENLQNMTNMLDDVAGELYQTAERITKEEQRLA